MSLYWGFRGGKLSFAAAFSDDRMVIDGTRLSPTTGLTAFFLDALYGNTNILQNFSVSAGPRERAADKETAWFCLTPSAQCDNWIAREFRDKKMVIGLDRRTGLTVQIGLPADGDSEGWVRAVIIDPDADVEHAIAIPEYLRDAKVRNPATGDPWGGIPAPAKLKRYVPRR
jgi:hypothetical protein